jgi:uncharacterized protein (DUF1501 family)
LLCLLLLTGFDAAAAPPHTLANNKWDMISLPANPGVTATVQALFGDDLTVGTYGSNGKWVLFGFDPQANRYTVLSLGSILQPATGYWMIQATGSAVVIDIPDTSTAFVGSSTPACPVTAGCIAVPLSSTGATATWQMLGRAGDTAMSLADTRVATAGSPCAGGCTTTQANNSHPNLLTHLSRALGAFQSALQDIGMQNQVTTFTATEFGRSLTPNGSGTDHGWGGHSLVMGGAVNGNDIHGIVPTLAANSSDTVENNRIIPTSSVDQYGATLARWFGLDEAELDTLFPNLRNFQVRDLGFMSA